jgi:HSF-type DNA-binding
MSVTETDVTGALESCSGIATNSNHPHAPTDEKMGETPSSGHNNDEEEDSAVNLFRINSGLLPFPEKLMSLLDGDKVSDAMWWLPDGDSFCLIPVVFAERVLDKHFQGTKFESFTRKLNRWYVRPHTRVLEC